MKQRRAQLVRGDSHVFLHLFRIFQFETQQAEAGIKEEDGERKKGREGEGERRRERETGREKEVQQERPGPTLAPRLAKKTSTFLENAQSLSLRVSDCDSSTGTPCVQHVGA